MFYSLFVLLGLALAFVIIRKITKSGKWFFKFTIKQNLDRYYFKIITWMIYGRGNNSKSETPTRGVHSNAKITRLAGIAKKSDPFLKELQDVYDKENINPNLKEQRVKSQYVSEHRNQEGKSPRQRTSIVKPTRTYNIHNYNAVKPKENDVLSSSSKYHSTELPRGSHKASSRKTDHSDNITVGQFQEEYYNAKEEKKEKKMKVMLKDVNKKRKSVQEN